MVEFRAEEFLAAVDAMTALNENNLPELESMGLSFVGKLDTNEIHYMVSILKLSMVCLLWTSAN